MDIKDFFATLVFMVKTVPVPERHTVADVRRLADQLDFFSARFRELAKRMEENGIKEVNIAHIPTRDKALLFLQGAMKHATSAVDSAIFSSKSLVDRTVEEAEKAEAEMEDSQKRKPKKKNSKA